MALSRIVMLYFEPGFARTFEEIFEKHRKRLLDLDGCDEVKVYRGADNSDDFITVSRWRDDESLQAYRKSELFREVWSKVKPRFRKRAEAFSFLQGPENGNKR